VVFALLAVRARAIDNRPYEGQCPDIIETKAGCDYGGYSPLFAF